MYARFTFGWLVAFTLACGGGDHPTSDPPDGNGPATDGGTVDALPDAGPYTGARAASITAYGNRACAITEDGELRCWGGTRAAPEPVMPGSKFVHVALGAGGDCAIRDDDSLWCGSTTGTLAQIAGSYKAVTVGEHHHCAITTTDGIVCWGTGTSGQLGTGDRMSYATPTPISGGPAAWSALAAGERHTCALATTGALYCWGFSSGTGDPDLNAPAPVAIAEGMTFTDLSAINGGTSAVRSDGALLQGSGSTLEQVGTATTWTKYRDTYGEGLQTHRCGLQGSTLVCWGSNWRGQLANASPAEQPQPQQIGEAGEYVDVAVGFRLTCAIRSADRSVHCFGAATVGQLGDDRPISPRTAPAQVGTAGEWATIHANQQRTCGVRKTGSLACWGGGVKSPYDAQTPVAIQPITDGVTDIALGLFHGCARRTTGMLACWGGNASGEVGNGTTMPSLTTAADTGLVAKVFSLGYAHTCATAADDRLHCWGNATYNRLGFTSMTNVTSPTLVGTDTWKALAASYSNTCGIRSDGTLHCWGFSFTGFEQLSTATTWTALATTPNDNEYWGISGGVLYRWSGNGGNKVPTAVAGTAGWTALAANYSHQCGARSDGTMQCIGANNAGELGDGTTTAATTPVQVATGTDWATVAVGYFHTCALRTNGTLMCWGANGNGEIGDGTSWSATRMTVRL